MSPGPAWRHYVEERAAVKHLLLLALVAFTSPLGLKVWVEPSNVAIVRSPAPGVCLGTTEIVTAGGTSICVQEQPADVVSKLGGLKHG